MARSKFKDTMYVDVYLLASQGNKKKEIAEQLGVGPLAFAKWINNNEALADAYNRGREKFKGSKGEGFIDYVYKQLPPKLQKLWNKIKEKKGSPGEIDLLLQDKGEKIQKQLFMQAWCCCNFNPSRACQMVNLSPSKFQRWMMDDDFKALIDQLQRHKKDFFEEGLVKAVKKGETAAVLFANRTLNRDRGYGDKSELEITGSVNHKHENLINFSEIGLPIELQKQIMHYVRLSRDKQNGISGALEYVERKDGVFAPVEDQEHEHVSTGED